MGKMIVVIPTYNEKDNIKSIVEAALEQDESIEVLVVDDASPDATASIVAEMQKSSKKNGEENGSRIHLLNRAGKGGLGPAYLAGFTHIIENFKDVSYIVEMDADFSHDPKVLQIFIKRMNSEQVDLLIGSRYCSSGISIINWPLKRLILSYYANVYARIVLGSKIKDITGGFKCFRFEVLKNMNFDYVLSKGYSFQIEMNYSIEKNGYSVAEESIVFTERRDGQSKMSGNIICEALFRVIRLKFRNKKKYFG